MTQTKRVVTMKGAPLELAGREVAVGDKAPAFSAVANDLGGFLFPEACEGKVCMLLSVPSLDTSVCSKEAKRFDSEAAGLEGRVEIVVISMDLPFAQKRWAEGAGVSHIKTVSDHRNAEFGKAYGTLIAELRLLARNVYVIDRKGVVRYVQKVKELTNEPDYDEALEAARGLA